MSICLYKFILPALMTTSLVYADETVSKHNFSFHGYTRINLSMSENGSTPAHFYAPGAGAKYRLGNESDLLVRLRLNYVNGNEYGTEPYIKAVVAAHGYQLNGNTSDFNLHKIPKAYIEFGNYLAKGINVWLGRRWYERKGSYINDYWWLNSGQWAQAGIGVEGIQLVGGEFKVSIFSFEDTNITSINSENSNKTDNAVMGTLNSNTLDLRLVDIDLNQNIKINFWALYALRYENKDIDYEYKNGFGLGMWFDSQKIFGGKNTLAVTYRAGAAMHKRTTNAIPVNETMGYNLDKSSVWEVNNTWIWDNKDSHALQWVMLARSENFGKDGSSGDTIDWYSTGIRPIYYLTQYLNIATELGIDYVDNEIIGASGSLTKLSLALQLSPTKGFMSRPVMRLYITYAKWSDAWIGYIGNQPDGAPYGDSNHGWVIGAQLEHIW